MELLLETRTKKTLERLAKTPHGTFIVWGPEASGKFASISKLAEELAGSGNSLVVKPEGKSIGIGQLQELQRQLQLKLARAKERRMVIIDNAHTMTHEAQNAALKLLEEPPLDTLVVLITHQPQQLLPTVRSRAHSLQFIQPTAEAAAAYLAKAYNLNITQATTVFKLADSSIGHAIALARDKARLAAVKELYKISTQFTSRDFYEQLINNPNLAENAAASLEMLLSLLRLQFRQAVAAKQQQAAYRLNHAIKTCLDQIEYLKANGNAKIAIDIMALEFAQ